ncbi:MAG: DMT family transporter [Rhodospirillales bacterium]|nr:DMT family transporter [Rhodospirillales bacterium]
MLESAAAWGAGCALAWGISDVIARFAGRSVGVLVATCTMMTVGAALVAIVMAASGEPFDWRLDGIHWLFGIGAGTVIGSILFYHAVTHGPVSLASPVVACYPAIAVPISVALGARPDPLHWGAMVATMAGVWLVARTTTRSDTSAPEYAPRVIRRTILFSLVAAATFAASLTAADQAVEIYGPWQTVLVVRLIGVVTIFAILLARRAPVRLPVRAWPILAAFGVMDTLGHLQLYIGLGLPHGEYAIVASVGYTVVTVVLARAFLREPVSALQWGGVGLVVGGVGVLAAFG